VEKVIDLALTAVVCLISSMKLSNNKLSIKDKILLAVILGVDKETKVPVGGLSFPFAPEISIDNLSDWVCVSKPVFYSTVSRMNRENYIFVDRSCVKITDKGKSYLGQNFPQLFLKNQKWDGYWRIIVFNIKESERYKRDKLRNYLIKIKFAPLSDGVWVSPLPIFGVINDLAGDSIYIEGKLQRKEEEQIMLYHKIIEINNEYGRLCIALKKAKNLQDRDTIPILKSQFLEVLARDPQMPIKLLPKEWLGTKAKRLFTNV